MTSRSPRMLVWTEWEFLGEGDRAGCHVGLTIGLRRELLGGYNGDSIWVAVLIRLRGSGTGI
jgi:hypothetical protein